MPRLATLLAATAILFAATAGEARAGCGGPLHWQANARVLHQPGHRTALVVGDSTMIYAGPHLAAQGLETSAQGCRQMAAGLELLRERRRLPHLVILALAANGGASTAQLDQALRLVGPKRVLGLVTARNWPTAATAMRSFAARHPDRVLLIDWRAYSAGHSSWFFTDGLHPDPTGAAIFSRLIADRAAGVIAPPANRLRRAAAAAHPRGCGTVRRGGGRLAVVVLRARGGHVSCRHARYLAARPPLQGFWRWQWYDGRAVSRGRWQDFYVRDAGRLVLATRRAT